MLHGLDDWVRRSKGGRVVDENDHGCQQNRQPRPALTVLIKPENRKANRTHSAVAHENPRTMRNLQ